MAKKTPTKRAAAKMTVRRKTPAETKTKSLTHSKTKTLTHPRREGGSDQCASAKHHASKKNKEAKRTAEARWKAAKAEAEGGNAVIVRLGDSDDAARGTFRVKEAHDRLPPSDDDEFSQDKATRQKRKRKMIKSKKQKYAPEHEQLPAKLSARARRATHDVSNFFLTNTMH